MAEEKYTGVEATAAINFSKRGIPILITASFNP